MTLSSSVVKKPMSGVSVSAKILLISGTDSDSGIGCLMFQALLLDNRPPLGPRPIVGGIRLRTSPYAFQSQFGVEQIPALAKGPRYGRSLEDDNNAQKYSVKLRALILYCLMHDPKHRISPKDLLTRTTKHIYDNYGIEDDKYESDLIQEALAEAENARLEDEREEGLQAGKSDAEKVKEDIAYEAKLDRKIRRNLRVTRGRRWTELPLWVEKSLTNDPDYRYWVNTRTGFMSWVCMRL